MKKIVLIILAVALFLTSVGIILASSGNKTITITYRNISIYIDGTKKVPDDEPFIYNGRTYVPLRFVSEALDKEVKWDGATNRIDINDKSTSTEEWKKVIEFTGGDSVKTQPFTIHSKTWKIAYSVKENYAGLGVFGFFVYSTSDPEGTSVGSAIATFKNGIASNETYIYEGGKSYFLDISAANCEYTITIYEQ